MLLYRTDHGLVLVTDGRALRLTDLSFDELLQDRSPVARLRAHAAKAPETDGATPQVLLAPIGSQEVWAAGVTYFRSRDARMDESRESGGATFYDRVYEAPRPEMFFKATAPRVVGPGGTVRVRRDSAWSVPEPELVLVINAAGAVVGYTVGNDVSARDIEGENPLYLPQAKVYDGACAIGPGVLFTEAALPPTTGIRLAITRGGSVAFEGQTTTGQIKRGFDELAGWLYRETTFPVGCYLFTGTGIVPPDDFTLASGDEVAITIDGIGTLTNTVA
ncbi:2-hydroxyhepta-2,4-diene-1,7-dioate isomerase [Luteitalea sp. TBR-22]|uniref:fumarylacetoacetate hydrolase family protein n=1 Tax=Luteitalea sp. TBR-22 TaxID=2802971 RepID=UPI001AFCCECF|nr:fumarylacetoacetate hydrolase family protein [Luteitalea sp. TBR-22]BCS35765.1 2-hydroxyhepta-2,4-diene-1,7-dioate isomerase [Luteitalea sp. TBR-22]